MTTCKGNSHVMPYV